MRVCVCVCVYVCVCVCVVVCDDVGVESCGVWFVVCGLWCVVCGVWFVVCGLAKRFLIRASHSWVYISLSRVESTHPHKRTLSL